ncbi:MAG: carboxylesterase family protein [Myxococcota bacterium]|nr:carboxylesterase family protein [Myxococcota bacterium]
MGDGGFVEQQPIASAQSGNLNLPTILGANGSGGIPFAWGVSDQGDLTKVDYEAMLHFFFGWDSARQITDLYSPEIWTNYLTPLSNILTDYLFGCSNQYVAQQTTSGLHAYRFNATDVNAVPSVSACTGEACHGDEVPFVFHSFQQLGIQNVTPDEEALSNTMIGYWSSFARNLNPNEIPLFTWPEFTTSGFKYLIFENSARTTQIDPIPNCVFWDGIGYDLSAGLLSPQP